jgi:hypothetical protein
MTISEVYQNLFGRNHIKDGDVIAMAEHGRVGGLSTGEGYKKVGLWDMPPTDPSKTNASYVLSFNANGDLVSVVKTIGSTNYTKLITPENGDTVVSTTKSIGVWT